MMLKIKAVWGRCEDVEWDVDVHMIPWTGNVYDILWARLDEKKIRSGAKQPV